MIFMVPTNPRPVVLSDSATLTSRYFSIESLIVMSGNNKTLTLPTPTRDIAGKASYFIHNGTGSLTLSGAFVTGSSYVMDTKSTAMVMVLPTAASTYKWNAISSGGIATGLTEGIQDIIGAMFTTTNTETGCTVTYQDSTGDIDISVDLKTNGGIVLESNALAVDLGASAITGHLEVGDGGTGVETLTAHGVVIGEGTSAVAVTTAGTAGQPLLSGGASADPNWGTLGVGYGGTGATTLTDHGLLIGNATSAVTAMAELATGQIPIGVTGSPPTTQACSGTAAATTVPISDGSAHLDTWISTATAATPGLVEHQNWGDYSPTWTFTTADPGTMTKVGRYMQVGNMVTFYCSCTSADGNNGVLTAVTLPVAPVDKDTYIPVRAYQLVNTTWTDAMGLIDATTPAGLVFRNIQTATDTQAVEYYISGSYEVSAT